MKHDSKALVGYEQRLYRKTPKPEIRSATGRTIGGAAVLFNEVSQNLGGFVEQFAPGAFTRTLQTADVVCLFNHDRSLILGRTSAGNVTYTQTDAGLFYEVTPLDTSAGNDAVTNVRGGLVVGSSIGFRCVRDEWSETETGFPLRTVLEAQLIDGGPVTSPAYLQTERGGAALAVRSFCNANGIDPETLPELEPESLRELLAPEPDETAPATGDPTEGDERDLSVSVVAVTVEVGDDDEEEPEPGECADDAAETTTLRAALDVRRRLLELEERRQRLGIPAA